MDKKKIGIITFNNAINYGAILQAHATQMIVDKLGYSAYLFTYKFDNNELPFPFVSRNIKTTISNLLFYKLRKTQMEAFKDYRKKMKFYKYKIENVEDLEKAKDDFDCLLIGSDQVWNPELGHDLSITLLDFYKNGPAKISYASSFGISQLPNEVESRFSAALSNFKYLSVRELQGADILSELLDRAVPVVLDPSMLLSSKEWDVYNEDYYFRKPYILLYDMHHSKSLIEATRRYSELYDVDVLVISRIKLKNPRFKTLYGVTPGNFLSLIKNANFIFTDSFHGTAFSIIYNKEFLTNVSSKNGEKLGSRIVSLLDTLNLKDRYVEEKFNLGDITKIQYDEVNKIMKQLKDESLSYLKNSLSKVK